MIQSVGMTERLRYACRRLWEMWMSVQVELNGCYSVGRLRQLNAYSSDLSSRRLITVCLLTPLPSLVVSLLKEILPLTSPDAGPYENWVFFIRMWVVTSYIGGSALVHMNQCIPRLQLSVCQIVFVGAFAAAVSTGIVFLTSVLTVFPLPFGLLLFGPPDIWVLAACFAYMVGPRWRADPSLWSEIKQQLDVFNSQVSLTFFYPIYIFGFVSLTGIYQAIFIIVLPIIRLVAKNRISRTLTTHDDMKPEVVVLTVEGFHALYVSNALHLATSWEFTTVVLTLDLAQFWLSMLDVIVTLREVQVLMTKIPREHSIANENFLQVAMRILAVDGAARPGVNSLNPATEPRFSGLRSGKAPDTEREPLYTDSVRVNNSKLQRYSITKQALFQGAQVVPLVTPDKFQARLLTTADKLPPEMDIAAIFSLADRALFIDKATRVLFITEYIVLIEYTEVMLPIIYSLHDIVLFYMHNGSFYPVLTGCSSAELLWSIVNVLVYAVLEFVSLVMVCLVLKRTLGFSSWKQLAFVLETQAASIQNKMTVTFLYAMQISLIHLGADFSFKFAWLHPPEPKS